MAPSAPAAAGAHDLGDCHSSEAMCVWLERFSRDHGFAGCRYAHLGHRVQLPGQAERPPLRFLSSQGEAVDPWRAGDPAVPEISTSFDPFAWSTRDNIELPDRQRAWLSVERLRGVKGGIAIPVQDYMAGPAYLSLFGRREDEIALLLKVAAHGLIASGIAFHRRAKEVLPTSNSRASPLTDRELNCLRHAASGATISQTASSLGIATRTVELHFARATRKLGAFNKLHAVALALSSGLIQI
ncbi:helix-turn-helix transcriptional regulator [Sphingobium sp.]|uniref:helix-turn-helix transcriptional regulator n=1 Tax=Sphingobium sp. TaxID=1912891 RepID=UPI002ED368D2